MNSKTKGKSGEREFASFLRSIGLKARRGQQYAGGTGSPDVICDQLPFHLEVKRVERLNLRTAVEQAERDAAGKPWMIAHRHNRGSWLVTLKAEDLFAALNSHHTQPQ